MALTLSEEIEYIQLSEQDELDASLLSHINAAYLPYLSDFRRYQILKGGAGAGKSVFIAQKIIYNMRYRVGYNVMVVRDVGKDNHDTTFQEMQKAIRQFGWEEYFQINNSNGKEEITCLTNENKCIFRGLIDVERVKSITFKTGDLICIWIEEASEINEHDFNQLDTRLRGKSDIPKHIILSFNPIDIDSWLKKRFFDFPLNAEDGYILETIYKNNAFLDEIYKRILESYKDTDWYHYQVYVLNQWGSISTARVFHNIVIEEFDTNWMRFANHRQGMDFGFNHANAFIQCGYRDGELYLFGEVWGKNQLNRDFIRTVNDMRIMKEISTTADSADPDKIEEWNQAGYNVRGALKGPGSLLAGINYLKGLPKIHIHSKLCPNAAREFTRMKYRELKDGTILEEVVEIDDDTIAAVRYATEDLHTGNVDSGLMSRSNW
jgi:phage terminase large subunit